MGQEASLPVNPDDQEFEQQARAPPSTANPPHHKTSPNKHHRQKAGKMIGAVFQKARGPHNSHKHHHHHQQQQQQHQQHQQQLQQQLQQQHDSYGAKEQVRAAAGAGEMPYVEGHPSYFATNGGGVGQPQPYPGSSPVSPPPVGMTQEQQQQYYQHQMYQQHQQGAMLDQQQQQQQQQYYPQAAHQGHHPQTALPPDYLQPPPSHQQPEGDGLMYPVQHSERSQGDDNDDGNHNNNKHASGGGRKMLAGFRSGSGRGAAILNSMRNLSLTNAMQRATHGHQKGGNVNDWETKWDEDDDDSDDEEDAPANAAVPQHSQFAAMPTVPPHATANNHADHINGSAVISPTNNNNYGSSQNRFASPPPTQPKPHLVTATPEAPGVAAVVGQTQSHLVSSKVPAVNNLEWDTGAADQMQLTKEGENAEDKPQIEMFLPLLRVLGKGSFGKVVLVQKQKGKESGALFAMKILRKTHLVKRRQIERTRTERKVLSVVNHPFIMKLHYAFQSPEKLYLVLDYCPGGELFFHLSRFRRFPERVARFYAAELLLAIGHLHKRGIIYRDLKPENVLLDADGHVKLGDFGLAKAGIKHPCEGATSMCGTPEYMAPEVLSQQGHGFCVDYWGLGMLLYEMMTGLPPWYTTDRAKLFRRLKSAPLDIPSYFSTQAASCVSALLERNPRRRLGVTGIRTAMEHEFFRSISWRSLYGKRIEAPIRPCEGWTPPEAAAEGNPLDAPNVPSMNGTTNVDAGDLDAATANFDNTFTRMPVETDDKGRDLDEIAEFEELNEDTFVGFTFDEIKDRDENGLVIQQQSPQKHPKQRPLDHESRTSSGNVRHID